MVCTPIDFPVLKIRDDARRKKVEERLAALVLNEEGMKKVQKLFIEEINLGLAKNPSRPPCLLMGNSFIPKLLDGTEDGDYMALDLGGTNFRVLLLKLRNGKINEEIIEYYSVPESKRMGPVEDLFDFLAFCIYDFVSRKKIPRKDIQLGFTFSFPMDQEALDVGILVKWTKSFKCIGGKGMDVVKMLNDAIVRVGGLGITVNAVLNDTSGTLVKGSYLDKRCAIGIILGTGNNACYMEHVSNIEKRPKDDEDDEVIVDLEWGAFGDNGGLEFARSEWDDLVDQQSLFAGHSTFEKCIGGKFLGEISRQILLSLSKEGMFGDKNMEILQNKEILTATHLSQIEKDNFSGTRFRTLEIAETVLMMRETDRHEVSVDDIYVLQYVAGLLSYRAVQLVSLLTGALLNRMQKPFCTIAVDGSLYEHHPRFKPLMYHLIAKYAPTRPFQIILARDGSGKGAALIAAIADKINKEKQRN